MVQSESIPTLNSDNKVFRFLVPLAVKFIRKRLARARPFVNEEEEGIHSTLTIEIDREDFVFSPTLVAKIVQSELIPNHFSHNRPCRTPKAANLHSTFHLPVHSLPHLLDKEEFHASVKTNYDLLVTIRTNSFLRLLNLTSKLNRANGIITAQATNYYSYAGGTDYLGGVANSSYRLRFVISITTLIGLVGGLASIGQPYLVRQMFRLHARCTRREREEEASRRALVLKFMEKLRQLNLFPSILPSPDLT